MKKRKGETGVLLVIKKGKHKHTEKEKKSVNKQKKKKEPLYLVFYT